MPVYVAEVTIGFEVHELVYLSQCYRIYVRGSGT